MKLKYIIVLVLVVSFGSILYGFNIKEEDETQGNKFIGMGTAGLFLVAMPLFLIKESKKGKKMEDYMLTRENIEKMRKNERREKKNSQ